MRTAILLSGGLDSIALAHWKRPEIAFTVRYGQMAEEAEVRAASAVCNVLGIQHALLEADIGGLGTGDLVGVPSLNVAPVSEWWPFRNQFLATVAGMKAVSLGIELLLVGSVKTDGIHADGTEEFYRRLNDLMSSQEGNLQVCAPALHLTSAELIKKSGVPVSVLSWAHSCHTANSACGRCRGCNKHFSVMQELGYAPY
jgi:7-cyano-7-deazaguanine synthase